jgi:hypothetical protein
MIEDFRIDPDDYIIGVDPAHGEDYSAVVIVKRFLVPECVEPPDESTQRHIASLFEKYQKAINDEIWGQMTGMASQDDSDTLTLEKFEAMCGRSKQRELELEADQLCSDVQRWLDDMEDYYAR